MTGVTTGVGNFAFIDGQNLYMGTAKREIDPWRIDLARFRVYLERKYKVNKAFYFLGYVHDNSDALYREIEDAGFVLIFRPHYLGMTSSKKGNVDSDLIFHTMKKLYKKESFDNVVLVSGDGDYKLLVDFLIEEKRFEKILFPDIRRASSLYRKIGRRYFASLDAPGVREKIGV